ncbi:MAG: hypothetical protein DRQ51_08890 [Gammaproteobacteria bacterium]|nr:MAG: hypothetical protein DRQ51_08890 [Gammaproteobacteria bacterium]
MQRSHNTTACKRYKIISAEFLINDSSHLVFNEALIDFRYAEVMLLAPPIIPLKNNRLQN